MVKNILSSRGSFSSILKGKSSAISRISQGNYFARFNDARSFSAADASLKKTALFDFHEKHGGKMVPYAGYSLPVQYANAGVKTEHLFVREKCGLFDVSHMGQVSLIPKEKSPSGVQKVQEFIMKLTPVDIPSLQKNQAALSVILKGDGGILDDTVITKQDGFVSMVVNGACKYKDLDHMSAFLKSSGYDKFLDIVHHEDKSLLALQGPLAMKVLQEEANIDLKTLPFMYKLASPVIISGVKCEVTRCGYTGEDGFEISIPSFNNAPTKVAEKLASRKDVMLAGLGARDSLRLEAGLCLYGNDIDDSKSVVEAGLLWVVSKNRREPSDIPFLGKERILNEMKNKPAMKRVGFWINGAPAREGCEVYDATEQTKIGFVSSGTFSPSLNNPIAMGYVNNNLKIGDKVKMKVRNKFVNAEIQKMPFVSANYYRV